MNTDTLRDFIVLVEHLNYTTAARELNMSQSSLSRHINELERSLGTQLFSRKGKLSLTVSGAILLEEASQIFTIEDRLIERIKKAEEMLQSTIKIEEYPFSPDVKSFLVNAINQFRKTYPGVSFEFVPVKHGLSIKDSLDSGYFDVGILVHNGTKQPDFSKEEDEFDIIPIYSAQSHLGIYLPKDLVPKHAHENESISVNILKEIPVILPLRPEYGNFKHNIIEICQEHGFSPEFSLREMQSFETLAMMDMSGCAQIALDADIMYSSSPFLIRNDCKYFSMEEEYYATPYLLFSKTNDSDALNAFYESTIRLAKL